MGLNKRVVRTAGWAALGALVAGLAGCQHGDYARKQHAERVDRLERTLTIAAESEAERPERLARFGGHVAQWWESDVERSRENPEQFAEYWREDMERWRERQPAYRETAWDVLWGKPERIEWNLITIFY